MFCFNCFWISSLWSEVICPLLIQSVPLQTKCFPTSQDRVCVGCLVVHDVYWSTSLQSSYWQPLLLQYPRFQLYSRYLQGWWVGSYSLVLASFLSLYTVATSDPGNLPEFLEFVHQIFFYILHTPDRCI